MISVNIFTPVYHRFSSTKKSLESIIKHLNSSVYPCKLIIGVNGVENDEMKEWLKSLSSSKVILYFGEKNVRKAEIVNYMYSKQNECSHVISIDSDMIAEEGNFIDEMVWAIEHFAEFGLLSSFQKEDNRHLWNFEEGLSQQKLKENIEIRYGNIRCVAGGCIILKKEIWEKIGGYSTYGRIYGHDDGLLMASNKEIGKEVGVIMTTKLVHPFDNDAGYANWKLKNLSNRKEKGYYD